MKRPTILQIYCCVSNPQLSMVLFLSNTLRELMLHNSEFYLNGPKAIWNHLKPVWGFSVRNAWDDQLIP